MTDTRADPRPQAQSLPAPNQAATALMQSTRSQKIGHGWGFTSTIATLSLIIGLVAGMATDGSLEVVNAYNLKNQKLQSRHSGPIAMGEASPEPTVTPAFYPENNHVEWSTSLPAGQVPAALDVRNDSNTHNRRIVFQITENGIPRQAAALFIRAGQQAVIRLPLGAYRLDIASTHVDMPWSQAQNEIAIPAFALPLRDSENDQIPTNRIFIAEDGKISHLQRPDRTSEKAIKKPKSDTTDSENGHEDQEYSTFEAAESTANTPGLPAEEANLAE